MPDYYEDHQELKKLARRIAAALGPDWNLREDVDSWASPVIEGGDGATIYIHLTKGRLSISGGYPIEYRLTYGVERPCITVSAEKDAATIARDIQRRFLPGYLKTYRVAREHQLESERDEITRQDNLVLLAKEMGMPARNGRVYIPTYSAGYGHAEIREGQPRSVDFTLHGVPFDMALRIAAILRG